MKILIPLLALFISHSALASDEFAGRWIGEGTVDRAELNQAKAAQLALDIQLDATSLHIKECWNTRESTADARGCITSVYEIRGDGEVWYRDEKIGDVFPGEVMLLIGDSQVAEQLLLEMKPDGSVRYEYSYVNFDGASIHRKGVLKRAS